MTEPKTPREFPCMDDSPENNGWGYNSEPRYLRQPEDDEEDVDGIREINFWANFNEDTITVVNRGDGSMECG